MIKKSWYREDVGRGVKILNIVIPLLFFVFYIEDFRTKIWSIYENGLGSLSQTNVTLLFCKELDVISSVLCIIISFYGAVLFFNVGSIMKRRKLLLRSLPVIWLFSTLSILKYYLALEGIEDTAPYVIFIVGGLTTAILYVIVGVVYSSSHLTIVVGIRKKMLIEIVPSKVYGLMNSSRTIVVK
ncbi:hypothetical protein EYV94_27690 [Puteibacter caeruleilacunae]|nr:hypothetical protein EYV94_27690 [Puteibacter caeruleilacunae]